MSIARPLALPTGSFFSAGVRTCALAVWLLASNGPAWGLTDGPVTALAFTPSGDQLIVGSDRQLELVATGSEKVIHRFESQIVKPFAVQFHPQEPQFAVVGGTPAEFATLEVFALGGECGGRWNFDDDMGTDLVWITASQLVAVTRSGNRYLFALGHTEARKLEAVHARGIRAVVALDQQRLVTAGADQSLRLTTLDAVQLSLTQHLGPVHDLAVRPLPDPDRRPELASAGGDQTVRFWQPTIGRLVRFVKLDSIPNCLVWSLDGSTLWAGCRDGNIRALDPLQARVTGQFHGGVGWVHCLDLSPDGKTLAIGGDRGWNLKTTIELSH